MLELTQNILKGSKRLSGLMLGLFILSGSLVQAAPEMGSIAPSFKMQDQSGKWHSLSDYKGRWVVVYFYPKDNTPGCTIEAGEFNKQLDKLQAMNTQVFGVSVDSVESHLDFANTLDLKFSLLSDTDKSVSEAYSVLNSLGPVSYARRETFIIDPEGVVAHHFKKVDPATHVEMVLTKLDELKKIYQ